MHQQRLFEIFFLADDTTNVAKLTDPCSTFFLHFCLQQKQAVEIILQHYAPVLKFLRVPDGGAFL